MILFLFIVFFFIVIIYYYRYLNMHQLYIKADQTQFDKFDYNFRIANNVLLYYYFSLNKIEFMNY